MNCMETRALVEDALDESFSGSQKRALDLHLSRCDGCRAHFAAERDEHRRWFQAMNEPDARRRLPDGYADDFVARMLSGNAVPQKRWAFVRAFRRIAAAVVTMLLFAGLSYAAVVAVDELGWGDAEEAVSEMRFPESSVVSEGGLSSDAAISDGGGSPAASSLSISPEQQTGGSNMIKPKAAAAVLSAAMSVAPLSAADGDSYRYIISTPYPEANVYHSAVSAPSSIDAGAYRVAGAAKELEARFRSCSRSVVIALNAMEFKTFIITFR